MPLSTLRQHCPSRFLLQSTNSSSCIHRLLLTTHNQYSDLSPNPDLNSDVCLIPTNSSAPLSSSNRGSLWAGGCSLTTSAFGRRKHTSFPSSGPSSPSRSRAKPQIHIVQRCLTSTNATYRRPCAFGYWMWLRVQLVVRSSILPHVTVFLP